MLTCEGFQEQLYDLASGALPPHRVAEAREHLRHCPQCAESLATYEETIRLARQLPPLTPPPTLLQRFRNALRAEAARRPQPGPKNDSSA